MHFSFILEIEIEIEIENKYINYERTRKYKPNN